LKVIVIIVGTATNVEPSTMITLIIIIPKGRVVVIPFG